MSVTAKHRRPSRAYRDGVCSRCGLPPKLPPGRELCAMCADLQWTTAAIAAAQQQSAPGSAPQGAQPALRYVDGLRTLPDGRDVRVSPAPGAVPIVRWLTTAETHRRGVL